RRVPQVLPPHQLKISLNNPMSRARYFAVAPSRISPNTAMRSPSRASAADGQQSAATESP
ncbi:MAG: hypothetical protein Q8K85_20400, partial [Hyphomicrobium sp.]|nr:hypothetical protein [Hyphomicrobium sp.]